MSNFRLTLVFLVLNIILLKSAEAPHFCFQITGFENIIPLAHDFQMITSLLIGDVRKLKRYLWLT